MIETIVVTLLIFGTSFCIGSFAVIAGFVVGFITVAINSPKYRR